MGKWKRKVYAGATLDQEYYITGSGAGKKPAPRRPRFSSVEERDEFNRRKARRRHALLINANFGPTSYYSTLTFDGDNEVFTFEEAKKIRDQYYRRLRYACPEAKISIYMGRGKTTRRIHLHMLSEGIEKELIIAKWPYGPVTNVQHLREHNIDKNTKKDLGRDYTALANYLFEHWNGDDGQGVKRYKHSNNFVQPEYDRPSPCRRVYTEQKPPRAPKGYMYVSSYATPYGYILFHYVRIPEPKPRI